MEKENRPISPLATFYSRQLQGLGTMKTKGVKGLISLVLV